MAKAVGEGDAGQGAAAQGGAGEGARFGVRARRSRAYWHSGSPAAVLVLEAEAMAISLIALADFVPPTLRERTWSLFWKRG